MPPARQHGHKKAAKAQGQEGWGGLAQSKLKQNQRDQLAIWAEAQASEPGEEAAKRWTWLVWHHRRLSYLPRGHSGSGKLPPSDVPGVGPGGRGGRGGVELRRGFPGRAGQGRAPGPRARPPPTPLTLGDGNGLEAVQLLEQAAPLGGVQAVDEVARALRRVQRLHGLLLGVGAQPPGAAEGAAREGERQQPPPAAAPGRRAGGGGGRARPQAARGPARQQRQQPGHGGLGRGDPRGSPGGRFLARLRLEEGAGLGRPRPDVLLAGSRGAGHHALPGPAPISPPLSSPFPSERPAAARVPPTRKTLSWAVGPGELRERAGGRCGRAPPGRGGAGRAGGSGEGSCLAVGSFGGMSQPRAALLRRRPFLPPVFPPSCLSSYPLRLASAPSEQPRSQTAAAAATPSGGARGDRAEQREGAGRGRGRAGAVCSPAPRAALPPV